MSGKRPVDVLVRGGRYGYSMGGLHLVSTYGTIEAGVRGAIKRLGEWAKVEPGGAAMAYDSIMIVRGPGSPTSGPYEAYVGYPKPTGPSPSGGVLWSARECQDAVLDGTLKPIRLRAVGDPYCPSDWEPYSS